jgi:iron complex outermembrane receptor protein
MTNAVANTANAFTKSNMKNFIYRVKPVTWAVMGLLLLLLSSPQSFAAKASRLEEVLVSARKKTESLQDMPISLTVFTQERLRLEGVSGVADIASRVPGLTIEPFPNNGTTLRIYIRCIGLGDVQITQDSPVAIYLDGVYIARSSATAVGVAELQRLEILRGPQGTLYGRNTTNRQTRRPSSEAIAFDQVFSLGNRALLRSKSSLNLPLTDTLAIKLAYLFESRDGFIENTGPGGDFGDRELQAWRLDLVWDVSEQFRLDYSYDHGSLESYNYMFQAINPPAVRGDKGQADAIKFSAQSHSKYGSRRFKEMATTAPLEAPTSYIDGPAANNANGGPTPLVKPTVSQPQSSHEFQFNGRAESLNLEYLLGAYYFEESGVEDNSPLHLQLRAPIDAFSPIHIVNFVSQKYDVENQAAALFGQLSWTPSILDDKLRLTLGARHSRNWRYALKNQRDETYFEIPAGFDNTRVFSPATLSELPILGPLLTPILYQAGLPGDRRFDNVAGKRRFKDSSFSGQFEYQFSDDMLFYGKVVEAYKSGGFNTRDPQLNGQQGEASDGIDYGVGFAEGFGSEKAKTAELGMKSEWLNGRLRVC